MKRLFKKNDMYPGMKYRTTDSAKGSILGNNGVRLSFVSREHNFNKEKGELR